jgi:hypothetical protein
MANIGAGCKYLLTPGHDYYVLPLSRHYTVSHTLFMRLFSRPCTFGVALCSPS